MALTRGYLTQHFQGKAGGFYPALLDVAQDYLLHICTAGTCSTSV